MTDTLELKRTVSHSEVEAYLSCERKHFYNYGMKIQKRVLPSALRRGTICHSALEAHFTVLKAGGSWEDAVTAALDNLIAHMRETPADHALCAEVKYALEWYFQAKPFEGWTILAIEYEVVIRVDDELDIPVVIDLIARDPRGRIWVIDHKTIYDFYSDRDLEVLTQLDKYVGVLMINGKPVDKAALHMLRYRQTKSEDPTDHNLLRVKEINKAEVQQVMGEQIIAAKRIQRRRKEVMASEDGLADWSADALRSTDKDKCSWCMFRQLCLAELRNESPELVLDQEYMLKPERVFEEATENG